MLTISQIIGAPAFFPTVWGWIKRWFDPVTVSKIFILSKHDMKSTLAKYMDPKDFPKRYGGELDWEWGSLPHLDQETRAALERDGNKGWVPGPCLWLDGQRVVAGSKNGKPRRADEDIEKKKPVVYAADYTEFPVHPDKKLSTLSKTNPDFKKHMSNGTAEAHHQAEQDAVAAAGGATAVNIIATNTNEQEVPIEGSNPEMQAEATESQAAHPAPTADSSTPAEPHPHPPALPAAGPPPPHTEAMTSAILDKLAGESVSSIPPTANGHANGHASEPSTGHPEVLLASDPSKGLAIEAEKLTLSDEKGQGQAQPERPQVERFVTATEV